MDVTNIPLETIGNEADKAVKIYKQWLRGGILTAVLSLKNNVNLTFQVLHSVMGNNFFSILLDISRLRSIKTNKLNVIQNIKSVEQLKQGLLDRVSLETADCSNISGEVYCFLFFTIYDKQTVFIAPAVTLMNTLPKELMPFGYYLYEGKKFFTLTDKRLKGRKLRIYASNTGHGSSVLFLPIFRHIIQKNLSENKEIEVLYDIKCPQYTIFPYVIKECSHRLYTADIKIMDLSELLQDESRQAEQLSGVINLMLINQTYISRFKHCHVICEALDMINLDCSEQFYNTLLPQFRLEIPSVSHHIQSRIHFLRKKYKYVVAAQLFTNSDYITNLNDELKKTWDLNEAQRFVDLCNQNQIAVVNIAPEKYLLHTDYDISYLSVGEIVNALVLFDAVVGVDSMGTLAAGVLGIPNITLWQKNRPENAETPNGAHDITFRSPTMNYSIVDDTSGNVIPAGQVFEILSRILNKDITLSQDMITYADTVAGKNMAYTN